eukprot:TRINITY_DN59820_c0_g1_i1.p2 TRINITY_DN59820_c0_g1~~TRINITY_DN59820_c0_g1_i1.p2  ORF type:complete len:108 (+),score=13.80 TRINITY_DN59820_c0_g1_i1:150-473(+)
MLQKRKHAKVCESWQSYGVLGLDWAASPACSTLLTPRGTQAKRLATGLKPLKASPKIGRTRILQKIAPAKPPTETIATEDKLRAAVAGDVRVKILRRKSALPACSGT